MANGKSSLDMIRDGLAARQGRSMFAGAGAIKTSIASIQSVREDFDAAHKRHESALRTISKAIADFDSAAVQRLAEFRNLKSRQNANGDDGSIRVRRSAQEIASFGRDIRAERIHHLRKLFATLDGELAETRRLMLAADHSIKVSRSGFDPLRLASSWELGSERRARLMAECQSLPPAALKGLALRAAADGDKELCGVLVAVNDSRQPSQRGFNSAELAGVVFAEKSKLANDHADYVIATATAAVLAERALSCGRTDSVARIEAALNAKETE